MSVETYRVVGMTCDHCVASVTEEVGEIPGVDRVEIELSSGRMNVHVAQPVARDVVEAAVVDAGYRLGADG
ncbi:heavy-metal-associated domain-containing protein [Nocardia sp. 348MFTsu5.1]|uniref:heavy-metal-associated domain-containing protein n=1 Tax=Nocardia sp. 348MFTsu5.1 TaxID=1172185 RepID=UPI00036A996C|nr:heavy-metal-associated domain-containing protein [Nocardia sp. 348MFTsu5.1]